MSTDFHLIKTNTCTSLYFNSRVCNIILLSISNDKKPGQKSGYILNYRE